jgi:hypothetical protein
MIDEAYRLVVDVFIKIPLLLQIMVDFLLSPAGPMMGVKDYLCLVAKEFDRLIDKIGPGLSVPDESATGS